MVATWKEGKLAALKAHGSIARWRVAGSLAAPLPHTLNTVTRQKRRPSTRLYTTQRRHCSQPKQTGQVWERSWVQISVCLRRVSGKLSTCTSVLSMSTITVCWPQVERLGSPTSKQSVPLPQRLVSNHCLHNTPVLGGIYACVQYPVPAQTWTWTLLTYRQPTKKAKLLSLHYQQVSVLLWTGCQILNCHTHSPPPSTPFKIHEYFTDGRAPTHPRAPTHLGTMGTHPTGHPWAPTHP